jgi:hypothetical protein
VARQVDDAYNINKDSNDKNLVKCVLGNRWYVFKFDVKKTNANNKDRTNFYFNEEHPVLSQIKFRLCLFSSAFGLKFPKFIAHYLRTQMLSIYFYINMSL